MVHGFADRLVARVEAISSVLCVGLDPRPPFPDHVYRGLGPDRSGHARAMERYCIELIEAVHPFAAAVKPQVAFFEALGGYGLTACERVCDAARERDLIVVVDAKRGDIASTAEAYAAAWLGRRSLDRGPIADALTVNPYLGGDSLTPFLAACRLTATGLYTLVRTSNPGALDLQELELATGERVWERVAAMVGAESQSTIGTAGLSSVGAVVGLTSPEAVARARELMPAAPLLLPGYGSQGGTAAAAKPAFKPHPAGGLVVAARSVIEAWRATAGAAAPAVAAAARAAREDLSRVAGLG